LVHEALSKKGSLKERQTRDFAGGRRKTLIVIERKKIKSQAKRERLK
jgi:hypothetical protein